MKKFLILNVLLVTQFASCSGPQKSKQMQFKIDYASLLKHDIETLSQNRTALRKTIYYIGEKEENLINEPDWKTELRPFLACDVQTSAFEKLYTSTEKTSGDSLIITYTAKEKRPEVRKLQILMMNDSLKEIKATLKKHNTYFNLHEELLYHPLQGYSINGSQKMMFAAETVYRIEAQFMPSK